jgi:hypothetical protein
MDGPEADAARQRELLDALIAQQRAAAEERAQRSREAAAVRASNPIWDRDEEWRAKRAANRKALEAAQMARELNECSFQPSLNRKGGKLAGVESRVVRQQEV